jgi:hypothetical protein
VREYTTSIDVGNVTEYTIGEDLDDCTTWYFAVSAYNSVGESDYSPEADWLTPMTVDGASADAPGQPIIQGAQFPMTVSGVGFQPGATIEIDHPDWVCPGGLDPDEQLACDDLLADLRNTVRLENPTIDCNSIQVLATIEPIVEGIAALVGEYRLTVTNPGAGSASNQQAFEVLKDPARFDINRSTADTDGRLDGSDIVWISRIFDTCLAVPGTASMPCSADKVSADFDPDYDFNGDCWIDGSDLADIASFTGHCWDGATWKTSACD